MTFEETLDRAMAMLQRRGRVTYRTLKRQFNLDDDALEDLKTELIEAQQVAIDEGGTVLVWAGAPAGGVGSTSEPTPAPRSYTPAHFVEKILLREAYDQAIAAAQRPLALAMAGGEVALADELGMGPLVAHCHYGLGRLYCLTDRNGLARTALAAAIELYRAMDMAFWLPHAEAALAQVEG